MAVFVTVTTNQAAMQQFLYGPTGFGVRWTRRAGDLVRNAAVRRAPRDTGTLANSITSSTAVFPGFVVATIGSTLNYALYRHEGTGLYGPRGTVIRPVRAKALRFESRGRPGPLPAGRRAPAPGQGSVVFAKFVRGTPGSHYLTDALNEVLGGLASMRRFKVRYR